MNYSYSDFSTEYSKLSDEYKNVILQLIESFEHDYENRNELMAFTLTVIMREKDISKNEIVNIIGEKENEKGICARETVVSAINRFSEGSIYFEDILDIVGVDIEYITDYSFYLRSHYLYNLWNEKYKKPDFSYLNWLWDTLSNQNKKIIYSLVRNLNNIDSFKNLHKYFDLDYLNLDELGLAQSQIKTDNYTIIGTVAKPPI